MTREEAINKVRQMSLPKETKEILEALAPELAESEDERIRKSILHKMKACQKQSNFFSKEEIAYLEKQKDCVVDNNKTSAEEDERIRARLIEYFKGFLEGYEDCYKDGGCVKWEGLDVKSILAWLEKQKEQNVVPSRETILGICWKEDPEEREGLTRLQYIQKYWTIHSKYWNEKCDYQKEQKPINNSTREKIISRATSEKQVVLLSESNGNAEIGWDTRSLEDAKKLLEYGIAFINERLGTKPAECGDDEKIRKGLIQHLKELRNWKAGTMSPIKVPAHYDAWITYLEKQQEQKPNIELIQKSWYMEGYHDKEFNCEPKWIIKTGEGGPRYEENPKYGQIIEQKPVEYLSKDKVYAIMNKLTELSTSELIPLNSDEYKKINEITSDVRSLLDCPIEQKPDIEICPHSIKSKSYQEEPEYYQHFDPDC
jgi:hypothetical protein